jgi:DNA-binding LytR/AlgR family response regulator
VTRSVPRPSVANIRIEKDGRGHFLAVGDVYAVRANAHYTFVHDGEREYFCNRSISALEAEFDPLEFARVHRSYIVHLARVSRIRKSGEAAVAELGEPVRCSIPIARGQYRDIKARIEALQRASGPAAREKRQSD